MTKGPLRASRLVAGARRANGLFFELRGTAYGVSNVKLIAGYNF
ncbi:MAG TPA: hypothetical protein VFU28_05715 [Vicinamibacterales bacterium]|nr:hypothetical protein [Vicinamibacterales bacterium]